MKGNIKITVEQTDDTGTFPITETYMIGRDNTYESIEEWIDVFKKIMFVVGFHPGTIEKAFGDEEE